MRPIAKLFFLTPDEIAGYCFPHFKAKLEKLWLYLYSSFVNWASCTRKWL